MLDEAAGEAFSKATLAVFAAFPTGKTPSESRTEDHLIWKILVLLGWEHSSRQVNLSPKGHKPDGLLFADAKARADRQAHEYRQYREGVAMVESKRWLRELDRKGSTKDDFGAPSTQMIRVSGPPGHRHRRASTPACPRAAPLTLPVDCHPGTCGRAARSATLPAVSDHPTIWPAPLSAFRAKASPWRRSLAAASGWARAISNRAVMVSALPFDRRERARSNLPIPTQIRPTFSASQGE